MIVYILRVVFFLFISAVSAGLYQTVKVVPARLGAVSQVSCESSSSKVAVLPH